MNEQRKHNFNPGPAALPLEVLEEAQEAFVEYGGLGMSMMEVSHRSKAYEQVHEETQSLLLEVLGLPSGYRVLFMGGGASAQFALVPMNLLTEGKSGVYLLSGSFAEKAYLEALTVGDAVVAASTKEQGWRVLPKTDGLPIPPNAAYVHMTTNNTIEGSQFRTFPEPAYDVPLIGDMTSDLLCRDIDLSRFALIYAGAQKNLGPAGVTAVIIRDDLLERASKTIPAIFRYATFADSGSLYNTPPVHSIYMVNLVLKWVQRQGGVAALERRNARKAQRIYEAIDVSGGFYQGIIEKDCRSIMNITWRMVSDALTPLFVEQSERYGFDGLAGHRSVGGLRASAYNAVTEESCRALADFMTDFQKRYG
ncbi:3-phosphoserine/phosphohydroxythreonine transaminase [Paenibacillus allorhizosphaerae]|uniref:Phosphoserine aminotransferase n=1 Tax=Paenibacillus allorhizosphaerae TaxID=2849866 RepID=A0ABM8VKX1_9BACL|nr:3-phosphoserine/phosphohydroxythreonine transaminase [Paenibacillus allorhizosphaerae]CAG7647726.1 Phosphoserine aminotransferase [Paenibacillus allorhizosphaerae]